MTMSRVSLAITLLAAGLLSTAAQAEMKDFHAALNGAAEVPTHSVPGTGKATATLDTATKTLTYSITYDGLTGAATGAHFHGPALAGANAGVVVPFKTAASPIHGSVVLTDPQIADLAAGKWYANVHTAANPGGEIRGQIMSGK